ncbi:MAG: hypothetical protein J6L82_03360 [Alphaproteobacteria bacterium]|nr:hypothetical protein [Alphaproteobacteria bacterium]
MATDKIALTSSMRSNLLSLKNTQDLLDKTQDRLSTGYKVNSAMDNPSSYFTAQSLNSRADDLSTLLDSIGQAISTLEVADEGITTLQEFVEQAKSIANSARDTANVASKAVSENVTFNSTTAKTDLLTDMVANAAAGDNFTIRLGDATTMEGTANVSADQTLQEIGIAEDGVIEMIVGDKTYEFTFTAAASGITDATVDETTGVTKQSFGIDTTLEDFMSEVVYTVGRKVLNAEVKEGKLTFNTLDNSSLVIRSTADFASGKTAQAAAINGATTAKFATGDATGATSVSGASIDITVNGQVQKVDISEFIDPTTGALVAGADTGATTLKAVVEKINSTLGSEGIVAQVNGANLEIYNKNNTATKPTVALTKGVINGGTGGNVTADASVQAGAVGAAVSTNFNKVFGFDEGYTVTITEGMTVEQFRQAVDGLEGISADFDSKGHMVISGEQGDDMVLADSGDGNFIRSLLGGNVVSATNGSNERAKYAEQFDGVLDQIDQLVQDTSYKGINLLNGDDLTVVFNESRTSTLELKGVTFNSTGLGFTASEAEWKDNANIDKSLDQITKATSLLRAQASEFGQNLSTVQIREDFTENMINNLQTGADKLTLADMNEEAANMLALQTRQQLGVNSLSMASQAAQSVLQLF